MLNKRVNALGMRLTDLIEKLCETRVAFDYGVEDIVHVVGEEFGGAAGDQAQVAAYLLDKLGLDAVVLQELDAYGDRLLRQPRVQVVE
jgi:hypothetical protein